VVSVGCVLLDSCVRYNVTIVRLTHMAGFMGRRSTGRINPGSKIAGISTVGLCSSLLMGFTMAC